jgi:integrase
VDSHPLLPDRAQVRPSHFAASARHAAQRPPSRRPDRARGQISSAPAGSAAQLGAFLDWSAAGSPHHVAWHVLAYTGMRRGELLALRWRDIDLERGIIAVRRSAGIVRLKGQPAVIRESDTKNKQSGTAAHDVLERRAAPLAGALLSARCARLVAHGLESSAEVAPGVSRGRLHRPRCT